MNWDFEFKGQAKKENDTLDENALVEKVTACIPQASLKAIQAGAHHTTDGKMKSGGGDPLSAAMGHSKTSCCSIF